MNVVPVDPLRRAKSGALDSLSPFAHPTVALPMRALLDAASQTGAQALVRLLTSRPLPAGVVVDATIIARRANQSYSVRIEHAEVVLDLPGSFEPGTALRIRLAALQDPHALAALANPTESAPEHDVTHLSTTGRFLSDVLRDSPSGMARDPLSVGAVEAAWDDAGKFADMLRDRIAQSGSFYESHLKDWVEGHYSLSDLRKEPQANFPSGNALLRPDTDTPGVNAYADAELSASALEPTEPSVPQLAERAFLLVRNQLETLDTGRGLWRIEVWPNQAAELEVGPEPENADPDAAGRGWRMSVKLTLPRLGSVTALASLKDDWVTISVTTGGSDAVVELKASRADALRALTDAGLKLHGFEVKHG